MILFIVERITGVLLIILLAFNLSQKTHLEHGSKKRYASLFLSFYILSLFVSVKIIERFVLSNLTFLFFIILCSSPLFIYRKKIFLFKFFCISCKKRLSIKQVLYYDRNKCETCNNLKDSVEE